jgi:hypothetical protein
MKCKYCKEKINVSDLFAFGRCCYNCWFKRDWRKR